MHAAHSRHTRAQVRSLIRLVVRSDTLTPVIFCDPMFFTLGYSRDLQRELLLQARAARIDTRRAKHHAPRKAPRAACATALALILLTCLTLGQI